MRPRLPLALMDEVVSPMKLKKAICLLLVVEVDLLPAPTQETLAEEKKIALCAGRYLL
jgi:hypothetical protein